MLGIVLAPGTASLSLEALWLTAFIYGIVGMVVTGHRPRNPVGWVFLGAGALQGFAWLASSLSARGTSSAESPPTTANLLDIAANVTFAPIMLLFTLFTVLLYPEGLLSPRWRPVLWAAVMATAVVVMGAALAGTVNLADADVTNPYGSEVWSGRLYGVATTVITACVVLAVLSAILRIRQSVGVERAQMRWFAFAVALVLVVFILFLVVPGFEQSRIGGVAIFAALACVPLSCGVAIMRYRLYEIDRIISRTLSYGLVTGLLLAVYAVVVTSVTQLLPGTSNTLAVAAATLAAAAAFRPVFRKVQAAVDRRFNRSRYDAQRTVETFAVRLRDEVSTEQVSDDLVAALQQTLQPARYSLWLRGTGR